LFAKKEANSGAVLEVTQQKVRSVSGIGCTSVARMLFMPVSESIEFTYDIQILFSTILHSNVSTLPNHFEICGLLSKSEDYKFCPGLEEKPYFDNYYIIIF